MICLIVVSHIRTLSPKKLVWISTWMKIEKRDFFFVIILSQHAQWEFSIANPFLTWIARLRVYFWRRCWPVTDWIFIFSSSACVGEFLDSMDTTCSEPANLLHRSTRECLHACCDLLGALSKLSSRWHFLFFESFVFSFQLEKTFLLSFKSHEVENKNFELSNKFLHFVLIFDERSADV